MLSDNRSQLVGVSVQGEVSTPVYAALPASPYVIGADGTPQLLPSPGGIVYNVNVGDSAYGWVADSVQPCVSIRHPQDGPNHALTTFACLGNEAIVLSGRALGRRGIVTGKSGRFAEHVIVHFADEARDQLSVNDKVLVRAFGRGLAIGNYEDVQLKSLSPALLDALEFEADERGITVPVVAEVPALLIGAGSGLVSESGSVQIQSDDAAALAEFGADELRLGDVVGIRDYDSRWGNGYLSGASALGIVAHGDSPRAGYGPGLTIVATAVDNRLRFEVTERRNIGELLQLTSAASVSA
jgi:hypothetical protein